MSRPTKEKIRERIYKTNSGELLNFIQAVDLVNWAIDEAMKPEEKKEPNAVDLVRDMVVGNAVHRDLKFAILELADRLDRAGL